MLPRIGDIDLTYSADNPHSEEQKNLFNEIQTADINYYFGNFTDLFNDSLIEEIIKLKNLLSKNYDKLQDNENINNINRWLILLEDVLKYTPSRDYHHMKEYFIKNTPWPEIMYHGYKLKDAISLLKPQELLDEKAIDIAGAICGAIVFVFIFHALPAALIPLHHAKHFLAIAGLIFGAGVGDYIGNRTYCTFFRSPEQTILDLGHSIADR